MNGPSSGQSAAPRRALRRERLALYLRILAFSAVIGALYGVAIAREGASGASLVIGMANGVFIAGCIGAIEIFLLREGSSMKRLLRLPFVAVVALKTLTYSAIVAALPVAHLSGLLFPEALRASPVDLRTELVTVGFSLAVTLVFVVVLQAAALVGRRTFRDLVLGRYRRPRLERRFFLFVDIVGSTPIAERLGACEAHGFLAQVFSAVSEPIAAHGGEIYQYVGDEIVVTWTEADGLVEARPLRCFFAMQAALGAAAAEFRARFGTEPALRAALHLGEVVAGEIGEQRRAIVFHGDVMNVAARLEHATREFGCQFIVSADAVAALGQVPEFGFSDLGVLALRGRQEPMRAWSIEAPALAH